MQPGNSIFFSGCLVSLRSSCIVDSFLAGIIRPVEPPTGDQGERPGFALLFKIADHPQPAPILNRAIVMTAPLPSLFPLDLAGARAIDRAVGDDLG